jgi:hypothetical protein
MQHIIKRQIIDITTTKKTEAYQLQQMVSEQYWRDIMLILENVFDKFSSEEIFLKINKLELDLGFITETDIEKGRWADIIYKKLHDQLMLIKNNEKLKLPEIEITRKLTVVEQWLYYMKQGYLPWNVLKIDSEWYVSVLNAFATDYELISQLRKLILSNKATAARIVFQHQRKFIIGLLECLTSQTQKKLPGVLKEVADTICISKQNQKIPGVKQKLLTQLWIFTLKFAAEEKHGPGFHEKLRQFLLQINFINEKKIDGVVLKGESNPDTSPEKPLRKTIEQKKSDHVEDSSTTAEEEIFVPNAGLIILHPFLKSFFKNLGLLDEDQFIDTERHQKALWILHYLATGKKQAAEHELVFAKILCGYPLHMPVETDILLSERETAEAEDLLSDTIRQWEILQNTTADGLREAFLQRNGKFYRQTDKQYLLMESHSIDVLLDHLPWNISVIKLPWMQDVLWVEWR